MNRLGEEIDHINHAIGAEFHAPMYLMHMYWARKPYNVVSRWIEHYSHDGDIILDPFCGSGVAPIEALKLGRKAMGIDINPMAIFISRMTAKPIDLKKFRKTFEHLKNGVKDKILSLYETKCNCSGRGIIKWVVWKNGEPMKIVYRCSCKNKFLSKTIDDNDKKKLKEIDSREVPYWHPKNKLYYPDGTPFKEGTHIEGIDKIDTLFTRRNLIALSILWNAIEGLKENDVKDLMKLTFTAILHLASKMIPDRISIGGPVWTQPRYWIPPRHRELNVWDTFEERFKKVFRGKSKSDKNQIVEDYREVGRFRDLQGCRGNTMFICNDAVFALRELPDNSVDYVFTDPTYGASIQYGELCYLWASWHGYGEDLLKDLKRDEVVINEEGQEKGFDDYYNMLYVIFKEVSRVLKPNRYMTVTFHNPSFEIRNALERAAYIGGFDLENVIYEPPLLFHRRKVLYNPTAQSVEIFILDSKT